MIILPGNNNLQLCPAAVMQIVQDHLNQNIGYGRDGLRVRVTNVTSKDGAFSFQVTTDKESNT